MLTVEVIFIILKAGLGDAQWRAELSEDGIRVHKLAIRERALPHSGKPEELLAKYGIDAAGIARAVKESWPKLRPISVPGRDARLRARTAQKPPIWAAFGIFPAWIERGVELPGHNYLKMRLWRRVAFVLLLWRSLWWRGLTT